MMILLAQSELQVDEISYSRFVQMTISKFLNLIKKINGIPKDLSQVASLGIHALQCASEMNSTTTTTMKSVPIFPTSQSS